MDKGVFSVFYFVLLFFAASSLAASPDHSRYQASTQNEYDCDAPLAHPEMLPPGQRFFSLFQKLGIDESQRDAIREVLRRQFEQGAPYHQELIDVRESIFENIKVYGIYEDQIRLSVQAHTGALIEIFMLRVKTFEEIRRILNDEQRLKLDEILTENHRARTHFLSKLKDC
ncbi:MAG: hypothetical protein MJA83_08795 [Gammaproteobacteria bacterium]|nr:hypothetical protein [Gammaproteobacteria bacterium]